MPEVFALCNFYIEQVNFVMDSFSLPHFVGTLHSCFRLLRDEGLLKCVEHRNAFLTNMNSGVFRTDTCSFDTLVLPIVIDVIYMVGIITRQ